MLIQDRGEILDRVETPEGFVRVKARFARSGIQQYLAGELKLTDKNPRDIINVYRPPDEVFSDESMGTFAGVPVTNNHPNVMLDSMNTKEFMVGFSGDTITRDDNYMIGTITLTDGKAIAAFKNGKKEISNGYRADLEWTPGTTPDGEKYDGVQRRIRGNHIALVDMGRCGPACRIMDHGSDHMDCGCKGTDKMPDVTVMVDNVAFSMTDQVASVVNNILSQRDTARTALTTAQNDIATRDATIAGLRNDLQAAQNAMPTGAALDALIVERSDVLGKAQAILGKDVALAGLPTGDVKKRAVDKVLGDTAKDYTPEQVSAAFAAISVSIKADPVRDTLLGAGPLTRDTPQNDASKAHAELLRVNSERWKGNQQARA